MGLFNGRQAANAGADQRAYALRLFLVQRITGGEPCILHGLDGGRQPQVGEAVHMAGFLGRDVGLDVEVLHLTRETRGQCRGVKTRDGCDARAAGDQAGPGLRHAIAHRADDAQAGHHNTTALQSAGHCGAFISNTRQVVVAWA